MKKELYLRPLRLSDIDAVMTWVNDPEVVKNFQHFKRRLMRKEELKFMKRLIKSPSEKVFSIFRKRDRQYFGQCAINQISRENKLGRASLFIKKEFWNQGHGQQVLPLLLKVAFEKIKLHKVWLIVYASNKKAIHIYKKLGFKQEGLLRDEYFWRGKYHDMVRMAIIGKGKSQPR